MMSARSWLLALFVAAFAATAGRAEEPYPSHVVKIVLPVLPGSTTDILARLVANQLSQTWGKPVIVENMPGAAMNIGSEYVAHAAPDGYTLLICPPSPLSIQQLLYHDLKYDPTKFVPIALLAKIPNVLAVRPDFPANTIKELIAYGKANPGKLTFASQGVGSTAHLSGSELEVLGGIKMVHVPYHGAQPALTDVMAGNVDMFFDTLTTSVPLYRAGKLKLLGVASAERAAPYRKCRPSPNRDCRASARSPGSPSPARPACPLRSPKRSTATSRKSCKSPKSSRSCARSGSIPWAARPPTPPNSSPTRPNCGIG